MIGYLAMKQLTNGFHLMPIRDHFGSFSHLIPLSLGDSYFYRLGGDRYLRRFYGVESLGSELPSLQCGHQRMWEEGQLAGWIEIEFLGGFNGFSWDSYIWWIKLPMKLPWGNNNPYTIYDLGYFLSMRVLTHSHMSSSFCWVDFSWDSSFSIFLVDLPIKDGDFPQFFVCFIFFMRKSTISMAIFQFANCKRLPEAIQNGGS